MTLTYISCSSDFYTFFVNVPLSLGCMIRKVSAEDIAIRGNGTGLEYMCPTRHFVYIFFNPVFQVSTAKNEINLFNNHILIVAPVTFAPAGAMTPSAEFLLLLKAICKQCRPRYEGQSDQCLHCLPFHQVPYLLKILGHHNSLHNLSYNLSTILPVVCLKCCCRSGKQCRP